MKKKLLKIHCWLAIPFGIIISILSFTGALILFRKELRPVIEFLFGEDNTFMRTVMRLHGSLMIPRGDGISVGSMLIGASAIAMSIIIITGIALWWPHNKEMLKRHLSVHLNKGFRRFVYDSHISLGIYSAAFLLLMSLTGPAWSFKWYNEGATATLSLFTHHDNETARQGHRAFTPEDKALVTLHTGSWCGYTVKVLYLLAAITGGFLPVSGYYMWIMRKRNKRPNHLKHIS